MRQQPRWPAATPWAERGPGPGRFRDTGADWIARAARRMIPRDLRRAVGRLSDQQLDERAQHATRLATSVPDTRDRYRTPDGQWHPDRIAMHRRIVDRVYARYAHVPQRREAIMAGGLPGAGKSTILGEQTRQYMPVDPDEMKAELIAEGAIPDIDGAGDLSPMELSPVIHRESSWLADQLLRRAVADGRSVLIDATMGDDSAPRSRGKLLRENGYQVRGMFVDVDIDVSLARAASRYRRGIRQWADGEGPGGRWVPTAFIEASRPAAPGGTTVNRRVFEDLAGDGLFNGGWEIHDNSGDAPRLLDRSS